MSGRCNNWLISPDEASFDPRYYRKDQIQDHSTKGTAGATLVGAFDEFDHSNSNNVQDVLKDLDSAIGQAMSGGEVNTASNINTAGVGVFDSKNLYDLQFKGIKSSDSHITVSDNTGDHTIDVVLDATAASSSSTLVSRDGSGNFSANNITATLTGNADTATQLETARNFSISGDASASAISFNGSSDVNFNITVDKVDGKDVDDTKSSTDYLWTAGKVISYITGKLNGLDWQESVKTQSLAVPPTSPATGDRYIVHSGGSGSWSGQDGKIAEWNGSSWDFITPDEGTALWIEDEDKNYTYNGSSWVTFGSTQNHNNMDGLQGGSSGQYYHLTSSQHNSLTAGSETTLHHHDSKYVNVTGDTMTGNLQITKDKPEIFLNKTNGQYGLIWFDTGNSHRWYMGSSSANEGGSNAGSDLVISRYDDAGNNIDSPLIITRSTGKITLNKKLNANGGLAQNGFTILSGSDTWLRTSGDNGWYSQTYGGGIHMTESTTVKIYNNKNFAVEGGNIIAGSTSKNSNTAIRVLSNDTHKAGFEAYGNSQGTGYVYVGQSTSHGGGIMYNGDDDPDIPQTADSISFYRKSSGTEYEVFRFSHDSDDVYFNSANLYANGNKIWHAGNDGAGSGLDADKLDGHGSSTSNTANTVAVRDSSSNINMNYAMTAYVSMSHSQTTRNSDTIFYSSTDNYVRKNTASGMRTSLGLKNTATTTYTVSTSNPSGGSDGDTWYKV